MEDIQEESGFTISLDMTGTYIGTDDWDTPAGNFTSCRKYLLSLTMVMTSDDYSYSTELLTYSYLASGVGIVGSEIVIYENGEEIISSTVVLSKILTESISP